MAWRRKQKAIKIQAMYRRVYARHHLRSTNKQPTPNVDADMASVGTGSTVSNFDIDDENADVDADDDAEEDANEEADDIYDDAPLRSFKTRFRSRQ